MMEERVEELILDVLQVHCELPVRRRTVSEKQCEMCGVENEQNFDCYGKPNSYRSHQVGTCLQNLRGRLDRLEAERKDASA